MATIPIYGGALQGLCVGSFVKHGRTFNVVRPGYDIQGRRRQHWTQVVYEDVPVYSVKMQSTLPQVMERFDAMWASTIGDDLDLMDKALEMTLTSHRRLFGDKLTGETISPTICFDGKGERNQNVT